MTVPNSPLLVGVLPAIFAPGERAGSVANGRALDQLRRGSLGKGGDSPSWAAVFRWAAFLALAIRVYALAAYVPPFGWLLAHAII